jgi:hypothetical protein
MEYRLYNPHHLGDHLFSISFFIYCITHISPDMQFYYMCPTEYHSELKVYIHFSNMHRKIILEHLRSNRENYLLFWINSPDITYKHYENNGTPFNLFLKNYFETWIRRLNIRHITFPLYLFSTSQLYTQEDLLPSIYQNIDIFIINSFGYSGQYNLHTYDWDLVAAALNTKYKVCTTRKVPGVLCVRDQALQLYHIGILTKKIQYIIGINTSILVAILHDQIQTCKSIYLMGRDSHMTYSNVKSIQHFSQLEIERINVIEECIKYLYKHILKREADPSGLQHYCQQYKNGMNFEMIGLDFMNSNEYLTKIIEQHYQLLHWRDSDESGKQTFVDYIKTNSNNKKKLYNIFRTSKESFEKRFQCYLNTCLESPKKTKMIEMKDIMYQEWKKTTRVQSFDSIFKKIYPKFAEFDL